MSLGVLAVLMAVLLVVTVARAIWRCDHPVRMRWRKCREQQRHIALERQLRRH